MSVSLATALDTVETAAVDCWYDVGPHFTCDEADAIEALLRALGLSRAADLLHEGHAESDEPGDRHYDDAKEAT